jgi:hypothetical protein
MKEAGLITKDDIQNLYHVNEHCSDERIPNFFIDQNKTVIKNAPFTGDIVFFRNSSNTIVHIGICINETDIIEINHGIPVSFRTISERNKVQYVSPFDVADNIKSIICPKKKVFNVDVNNLKLELVNNFQQEIKKKLEYDFVLFLIDNKPTDVFIEDIKIEYGSIMSRYNLDEIAERQWKTKYFTDNKNNIFDKICEQKLRN